MGWVFGIGEFDKFDGRAVFDDERDADAVGRAVARNQDFTASKLGGEIGHFKRDVRNLPGEIRDGASASKRIHLTPDSQCWASKLISSVQPANSLIR